MPPQTSHLLPTSIQSACNGPVMQAALTDEQRSSVLGKLLAAARPPVRGNDDSSPASQLDAQRLTVQVSAILRCSPCMDSHVCCSLKMLCMVCPAQAMGQLCASGQLSTTELQQVASCLLDILGAHTEGSQRPEESATASRLFFAVLRTLQTVLLQVAASCCLPTISGM